MRTAGNGVEWQERLIPLPKRVIVEQSVLVTRDEVSLRLPTEPWSVLPTIEALLRPLAPAKAGGRFEIRLGLATEDGLGCSEEMRQAVRGCPQPDQAYAVEPVYEGEGCTALALVANGPWGLLYAARTLAQLISAPSDPGDAIEVPCARILDWPDLAERGQWGGNTSDDIEWTSQWKLNVVEVSAGAHADQDGTPAISMGQELIDRANALGVQIVPYVPHLESISQGAGLMHRPELTSTPDPSQPLPPEYVPGLCMSSPATADLVAGWLTRIAELEGVTDLQVWLSEQRSPCFCDRCAGKEPFVLEVECIVKAFRQAQAIHPGLRLRILLTQGSYAVNDQVLAAVPEDVGVTYYDGGRTYDSSHAPMIYPLLEAYARSGRWLGVYPQITHCWRTVFPWTAPQLLQSRAREFHDKGLQCVIGYAVPSNRHHEFNVMALAEWAWNAEGRSVSEFCRAYAHQTGCCDPDLFARWAEKAGEAGWWLAESRLLLKAIYDPEFVLRPVIYDDFRFELSDLLYRRPQIEAALVTARQALELAHEASVEDMVDESEALCAGLRALLAVDTARPLLGEPALGAEARAELAAALAELDAAAAILSTRVSRWGARVDRTLESGSRFRAPSRLRDTAQVLCKVADAAHARAADLGVPDANPEHRLLSLGAWSAADFTNGKAELTFDVSQPVAQHPGVWFVGFDYDQGDYGALVKRVSLSIDSPEPSRRVVEAYDGDLYVGRWERWHEAKMVVPELPADARLTLQIALEAQVLGTLRREGDWECSGRLGLRRGWPGE